MTIFLNTGLFIASFTVLMLHPLDYRKSIADFYNFPLIGGSYFKLIKQVRYFLKSPTTITLDKQGKAFFI
jgi:hypothetical protein